MFKILTLTAFCCLLVSGCSLNSVKGEPLKPSELNMNAAHYNGQTVVVRGFIKLAPEGHVLYESQALDAEFARGVDEGGYFDVKKFDKYCLTIANPSIFYKNQTVLNGRTLVIEGKFIDDYLDGNSIDFGACPLPTAIVVDEVNFKQRYGGLLKTN